MRRQCLQMLLCQQTEMKKNQVEKRPSEADVYLAEAVAERAADVTVHILYLVKLKVNFDN